MPYPPPAGPSTPQPRWGRFAAWTAAAAVASFAVCGGLTVLLDGDSDGGSNSLGEEACKAALTKNYRRAVADPGGPTPGVPAAVRCWTGRRWSGSAVS
jgi:hypothetical protein